ncbi:MAG: type III pantothenate kinase [Burkholderiaceae bacterium]
MTVLLVDIGNSRIKWRLADIASAADPQRIIWQGPEQVFTYEDHDDPGVHWHPIASRAVDTVLISNVSHTARAAHVAEALAAVWPDAAIRQVWPTASQSGVVNGYRVPEQLGADRWLAAIGAHRLYPTRTLLICNFGTATTIDLLLAASPGAAGALFVGGSILPGLETMRMSLSSGTARLPLAHGAVVDFADRTEDAIASGIMAAQLGAVERSLRAARIRAASALNAYPLLCVTTGGAAPAVSDSIAEIGVPTAHVPGLVLHGLATVASGTGATTQHPA